MTTYFSIFTPDRSWPTDYWPEPSDVVVTGIVDLTSKPRDLTLTSRGRGYTLTSKAHGMALTSRGRNS